MSKSIQGKVKSIEYNDHSESLWKLDIPGFCPSFNCTDLADTPSDYEKFLGNQIEFEAAIQIAHFAAEPKAKNHSISFPINSCFVEFTGVICDICDDDEFKIDINGRLFSLESEDEIKLDVGDKVSGSGEMRISIPSIKSAQ